MKPHGLQTIAAACLHGGVLFAATTLAADAQTWHWTYVTRTPNSPLLTAQSSVAISGNRVEMSYTVPLQDRQVVIESCRANLHDISEATTIRTSGTSYLLVRFKQTAVCASGQQPGIALPADDAKLINRVAAAINQTCCTAGAIAAAPTPAAKPTPAASPAPSPAPTAAPAASPSPSSAPTPRPSPTPLREAVRNWVENDGIFWFVRLRNAGPAAVAPAGEVFDCRDVAIGCGAFARTVIAPGATATVATIASTSYGTVPTFTYRYTFAQGPDAVSGSGSSRKRLPSGEARMSAQDVRAAQAFALNQFESPAPRATSAASVHPPRLVKRGSSRLAIGQTGTAVVRLTIAPDGTPQEAAIVSVTNKQLTAAAIETAVSSTYAPATQNGRTVEAKYIATFSFDGQDPALSAIPLWKRSPLPAPSPPASSSLQSAPSAQGTPSSQPSAAPPVTQSSAAQTSATPAPAAIPPGGGADAPPPTPPALAGPSAPPVAAPSPSPASPAAPATSTPIPHQ